MDEHEITNNEYRQFVNFVIDSIKRELTGDDALYVINDDEGTCYINYDEEPDWEKYKDELEPLYYGADERFQEGKNKLR